MDVLWAVIYGMIQGITEYLPVSSSGHLALLPAFFDFKDPGFFFDLLMHFGTALAIIIYFRRKLLTLVTQYLSIFKTRSFKENPYAVNFTIATIVSVLAILIVKDFALEFGRNSRLIGINLIVFGVILYLADLTKTKGLNLLKDRGYLTSAIIGFSQMIAIFPGVSRSGITISSARLMGLNRKDASEFSFLLSLPIILASIIYKIPKIITGEQPIGELLPVIVGVLVSFIVGLLTIHFFLKIIKKVGFGVFAVYRIILGITVLIYL